MLLKPFVVGHFGKTKKGLKPTLFLTIIANFTQQRIDSKKMNDLEELRKAIVKFTQERDWDQFHNGKDLALALSIEASELNEAFLWKEAKDANVDKVKEELADIINYAILIADKYNLDIKQIVLDKLRRNAEKYPVEKAYGSAKKYNEL